MTVLTRAAVPDTMWTTRQPAGSDTPRAANQPCCSHTQWAGRGKIMIEKLKESFKRNSFQNNYLIASRSCPVGWARSHIALPTIVLGRAETTACSAHCR